MTDLFLKLFVKNFKDAQNNSVREKVGKMSGIVGIVLNVLLAAAKIAVGALFGVLSVLADGINNLTDCGGNVVSLVSIKLSAKPADSEHPYGHRRMEYIASMIVAFIVLVLAFELGAESVEKVILLCKGAAGVLDFDLWIVGALSLSILVKLWMFVFNLRLSKRYSSDLLKATAIDSISDVCSTAAVLIAVVISHFASVNLDGPMGFVVAVVIAVAGIKILKETCNRLLGEAPDEQVTKNIETRVKNFDGVLGIHDLDIHNYGPNKYYASVHVEVDAAVNVMHSHELLDRIERDFRENTDITLVTHLDPVVTGDAELDEYKSEVEQIVRSLDEHFSIHDFRMVKGPTLTTLIFDVAVHYDTKLSAEEIKNYVQTELDKKHCGVYVVPTVDRQIKSDDEKHNRRKRK